jgi:hypothetical protein
MEEGAITEYGSRMKSMWGALQWVLLTDDLLLYAEETTDTQ